MSRDRVCSKKQAEAWRCRLVTQWQRTTPKPITSRTRPVIGERHDCRCVRIQALQEIGHAMTVQKLGHRQNGGGTIRDRLVALRTLGNKFKRLAPIFWQFIINRQRVMGQGWEAREILGALGRRCTTPHQRDRESRLEASIAFRATWREGLTNGRVA
jgi:hypothetical protein